MPHFMIVLILYINLFNLSRIKKKMSFLEEYGDFKKSLLSKKKNRGN